MKKTQTNQTATTPDATAAPAAATQNIPKILADAAAAARAQSAVRDRVVDYRPSHFAKIAFLLETSAATEREFFHELLGEWETSPYTLPEVAFMKGASAQGINWIGEVDDIANENKMLSGLRLVALKGDWLIRFLRRLLESYDYNNPMTPDDVAEDLDQYLIDFQHEIGDARKLIENHPETVAREIRELIHKRPELVATREEAR